MEPILSAISLAPSTSLLWSIRPPSTPRRKLAMVILPPSASICACISCAAAAFCCISASCSGVMAAICSGVGMDCWAPSPVSLVPVMSSMESGSIPWLRDRTTVSGRLMMLASLLPSARSSSVPWYVRMPFWSALPNAASTVLASLALIKSSRSSSASARMVSGTGEAMPPCCTPTSTMSLIYVGSARSALQLITMSTIAASSASTCLLKSLRILTRHLSFLGCGQ